MDMDPYFEEDGLPGNFDSGDAFSSKNGESDSGAVSVSGDNDDGNFDCNICLDSVREPVVTLCGHLFCWPCIHKWLHPQRISAIDEQERHKQCPVCKSKVSHTTLVPLYGRGGCSTTEDGSKTTTPRRPLGPIYRVEMPSPLSQSSPNPQRIHLNNPHGPRTRMYYSQQDGYYPPLLRSSSLSYSTVLNPVMVMFGEMISTGLFGAQVTDAFTYPDAYNLVGTSGPRMRRQMMETDKSLSRLCIFLMCCVVLCLLLF
ncbi:PREDICTED: E3 ubiquitin-protein ligase RMA1-like [Tarenaya hassleriana]|uniref:E3 ubiquitin-protein ligase RMA1-like n=1 Tax=Tarenaya hassleriana TaxID=28532 RepID=UPI00053C721A|nr:PREDICTED: E3 ubiquitin-protein ligase RMA1-like [Tarenaya hassleriana]